MSDAEIRRTFRVLLDPVMRGSADKVALRHLLPAMLNAPVRLPPVPRPAGPRRWSP